MSRLAAAWRNDLRLQWRQGFWAAAAFTSATVGLLLRPLPEPSALYVLPVLLLANLIVGTFYFPAALVLLEKDEGSLRALAASPLRPAEYLLSKALSLGLLGFVESLAVVVLAVGVDFRPFPFALAAGIAGAQYVGFALVSVARHSSLNAYLMPSVLWVTLLSIPQLPYLGMPSGLWMLLHPMQAPLVLFQGAFGPLAPWQWAYGILYGGLWALLALVLARRRSGPRLATGGETA